MALVPLPDIDGDPRITRPDYKAGRAKITAKEVIRALIKLRFPKELNVVVRHHYDSVVVNKEVSRRTILDGQRIMVLIDDYDASLRSQSQYKPIRKVFLQNIKINGLMDDDEEKRFKNLLMTFFLPKSCDRHTPHDDWIMMAISITVEVDIEILLSTGNAEDVEKLIKWTVDVLKPRRNMAFCVESWLFNCWLHMYRRLIDRTRQFNLTQPGVLALDQASLDAAMSTPLPPTAPDNQYFSSKPKEDLKTVFAQRQVPIDTYGSPTSIPYDNRMSYSRQSKASILREIILSYVLSRMVSTAGQSNSKETFVNALNEFQRQDFSKRPMGQAMTEYGDIISRTETYKKILKAVKSSIWTSERKFMELVTLHILPPIPPVIYDRVMTVCLLASDMINECFTLGNVLKYASTLIIHQTCQCFEQSPITGKIIQEGLFRLAHFLPEIKRKTQLNLLHDRTLIGEPAQIIPSILVLKQTVPTISLPVKPGVAATATAAGAEGPAETARAPEADLVAGAAGTAEAAGAAGTAEAAGPAGPALTAGPAPKPVATSEETKIDISISLTTEEAATSAVVKGSTSTLKRTQNITSVLSTKKRTVVLHVETDVKKVMDGMLDTVEQNKSTFEDYRSLIGTSPEPDFPIGGDKPSSSSGSATSKK